MQGAFLVQRERFYDDGKADSSDLRDNRPQPKKSELGIDFCASGFKAYTKRPYFLGTLSRNDGPGSAKSPETPIKVNHHITFSRNKMASSSSFSDNRPISLASLTDEQRETLANFRSITHIDSIGKSVAILAKYRWNLEVNSEQQSKDT